MAEDYRSVRTYPAIRAFTGAATYTEIKIPSNATEVEIGSTSLLWMATDVADGDAVAAGDNKGFIVANNYYPLKLGKGATRQETIYVAADTGTPKIVVIFKE